MIFQGLRCFSRACAGQPRLRPPASLLKPLSRSVFPRNFSSSSRHDAYVRFSDSQHPQRPKRNLSDFRNWDPRVKIAVIIGGVGTIYYVSHLEQVPDTGRWRFMNTSPRFEAKFGEAMSEELRAELKDNTLPPYHPMSRHVRRVVSRILHASNLGLIRGEAQPTFLSPFGVGFDAEGRSWNPDADVGAAKDPGAVYGPNKEWDVIVVNDSKMINAMASPGLIVVFTGILPVCQDEEGLAAVLAHEIGHVVARHTAERLSSQTVLITVFLMLHLIGVSWEVSDVFSRFVLELPNSRKQEREADLIGLRLMSRACYDPAASPRMFSRLAQVESKLGPQINLNFFRTHPTSESRVKHLEEVLPEGYAILAANPECEEMRRQLEEFKQTAHEVKIDDGGIQFS